MFSPLSFFFFFFLSLFFLLFCIFFSFGVKYSWQPLLCNRLPLPQPTATHFIPNSAFYFQASEQWDEEFALKMCSEESGCHMCLERFLSSPLSGESWQGLWCYLGAGIWVNTRRKRVSGMMGGGHSLGTKPERSGSLLQLSCCLSFPSAVHCSVMEMSEEKWYGWC